MIHQFHVSSKQRNVVKHVTINVLKYEIFVLILWEDSRFQPWVETFLNATFKKIKDFSMFS